MSTGENFKIWINQFRRKNNLKIGDISEKLGVSYSTAANYCSNGREPSLFFLNKLSETFDIEIEFLLRFLPASKIEQAGYKPSEILKVERKTDKLNDALNYTEYEFLQEEENPDFQEILRKKDEHINKLESENNELRQRVNDLIKIMANLNKSVA